MLLVTLLCAHFCNAADSLGTAGPFHPRCSASFWRLPIDELGYPIDTDAQGNRAGATSVEKHILDHRSAYSAYDRDCFKPYDDLQPHTRQFIGAGLGLVSTDDPDFFCIAFRIGADVIMTAGHCAYDIDGAGEKVFRLIGYPQMDIQILEQLEPKVQEPIEDYNDFSLFRIQNPNIDGFWGRGDFSRTIKPNQVVLIIAVSLIPRLLKPRENGASWVEDVRFSRAFSSKTWPVEKVQTNIPGSVERDECIYHQAPTFPGMSGAPIISVRLPSSASAPPIFTVIGIHLRNGSDSEKDCGEALSFNVGIKIPQSILDIIK